MHSRDPYIRLFSQVVFDEDVTMRLSEREVPWWLRAAPREAARKAYCSPRVPRERS